MPAHDEVPTGETAKVFTGIRDVPIYAGESSKGNRLPGGPYRSTELIAIGLIVGPALWWFRTHEDGGFAVLAGAAVAALCGDGDTAHGAAQAAALSGRARQFRGGLSAAPTCVRRSAADRQWSWPAAVIHASITASIHRWRSSAI